MNKLSSISKALWFRALTLAIVLGYLINWTYQFPIGYSAGLNDHSVLSLEGIQWADPSKFVNDWFMDSAPQPHWFFDFITFVGYSTDSLSILYFTYWLAGLVAFGFATNILADKWIPKHSFVSALAMTLVISQTPWYVVGSGSTMIAQALPTVLAGQLLYLTLALLLAGKHSLIPYTAALVAIVHVQQGAVIAIILLFTWLVQLIVNKDKHFRLLLGGLLAASWTIFGLWLRPIAANLNDFIEVCDTIIPYHCAAHTWSGFTIIGFLGLIGLSVLSLSLVRPGEKTVWITSVGLAAFGLSAGMILDYFEIPIFGELAQAVNVYRLGVVMIPFAAWGILFPVLKAEFSKKYFLLFIIWASLLISYWQLSGWGFGGLKSHGAILVFVTICCAYIVVQSKRLPTSQFNIDKARSLGILGLGVMFVFFSYLAGSVIIRPLNITFMPDRPLANWGQQVETIVPTGDVILAPPLSHTFRLITGRAVIADCKTVPYGGKAWREWQARITDLGGVEQCTDASKEAFTKFDANRLVQIADKYSANYMILDPLQFNNLKKNLNNQGWFELLGPTDGVMATLVGKLD